MMKKTVGNRECNRECIIRICSQSAKWTKRITVGQTMWFLAAFRKEEKVHQNKISQLSLLDPFPISSQLFSDFQWPFIKVEFRK